MVKAKSEIRSPFSDYCVDIGIECHVQLKTDSKLFCGCGNDAREAEPNTLICPVCMGLPGTLPVLNKRAVELSIQAGLALNSEIAVDSKFDRKNYFYPDLPKGYQITQFDKPIVGHGEIEVPISVAGSGQPLDNARGKQAAEEKSFKVGITRAHLEEDAGKLIHPEGADYSLVDLNRAGTPLLEIVSEPDIHSPEQAKAYALELYNRMRYAEVSDVNLYYGNMRFDVNVSVRKKGARTMGTRSETKNLNSFRSVEKAAEYEIKRQIELLEKGGKVVQETRGYDDSTGKTVSQRSKEEAMDYRYFPEPDLPPLVITKEIIEEIKKSMPILLPQIREEILSVGADISQFQAIINEPQLVWLYLEVIGKTDKKTAKRVAGWLSGEVSRSVASEDFNWHEFHLDNERLIKLAGMVEENSLSSTAAKEVLQEMISGSEEPVKIAERLQVVQVSDVSELEKYVEQVIAENPKAAEDVRNGEMKAIGFLVGQVMKLSRGQANPQGVQELLRKRLQG